MKRSSVELCLRLCLLTWCFFLAYEPMSPAGYTCDKQCRERQYFYDTGISKGYQFQYATCLYCTQYGCVDTDPPLAGSCQKTTTEQMFKIINTNAICSFNPGDTVEANPATALGKFYDFFQKVYKCQ